MCCRPKEVRRRKEMCRCPKEVRHRPRSIAAKRLTKSGGDERRAGGSHRRWGKPEVDDAEGGWRRRWYWRGVTPKVRSEVREREKRQMKSEVREGTEVKWKWSPGAAPAKWNRVFIYFWRNFVRTNSLINKLFSTKISSKIYVIPLRIILALAGTLAPRDGNYFRRNSVGINIFSKELFLMKYSVENILIPTELFC